MNFQVFDGCLASFRKQTRVVKLFLRRKPDLSYIILGINHDKIKESALMK